MEIKNRIKKIIEESGLSASKFADKIGVPRSGLSHVLSGRNKPSLDYVLKILNAYPELDALWLLKGEKSIDLNVQIEDEKDEFVNVENPNNLNSSLASLNKKMEGQADKLVAKMVNVDFEESVEDARGLIKEPKSKIVDRIVYFYSDGSFKEFFPAK